MKSIVAVHGKRCKFCGGELYWTAETPIFVARASYEKVNKKPFSYRLKLYAVYDNSLAGTTRVCANVPTAKDRCLSMKIIYQCWKCGEEREYIYEMSDLSNSEVG